MPPKKSGRGRKRGRPKDEGLAARRRDEIIACATRVFAERGYSNTDLQEVADELRVGKGTLYRYFPSKRELFLAAVDEGLRLLTEEVIAAAGDATDPFDCLLRAFRCHLAFFRKNPDVVELVVQERAEFRDRAEATYFQHRDAGIGPWQDVLASLSAEGRLRDIPAARITDVITDILYGLIFNSQASRKKSLAAQTEDLLDILFNGILGKRARIPAATANP